MPRRRRLGQCEYVHHVINRSVRRVVLFDSDGAYESFERVLQEARARFPMRVLAYCIMPNHWHLVLWPRYDRTLSDFMRWLTCTHTQRWHAAHSTTGTGPLYQGRFKSIPIQGGRHFYAVCRYVERNPLRAGLVTAAQNWRFGSLWRRSRNSDLSCLDPWPLPEPGDWVHRVNRPESHAELADIRAALAHGRPLGESDWQQAAASVFGLQASFGRLGRPSSESDDKAKIVPENDSRPRQA